MSDFIRERVCFYNPVLKEHSSIWDTINYAARYGAAGVELLSFYQGLENADMKSAMEIGAYAKGKGLVIPCFSVGAIDAADEMPRLRRYAEICSALEIPYLHHTIFMSLDAKDVSGREDELFARGCEAALELNYYAARLGVKTVAEDQGLIFNGVENYGRFIKATDGKIGTVLDVGNIMFVGERAENFGREFAYNVDHVHLKDYAVKKEFPEGEQKVYTSFNGDYLLPREIGTGDVNFTAVAELLSGVGYLGYYSMEFECVKDEDEVARALDFVSRVMGNC